MPTVPFKELRGETVAESSAEIREKVERVRAVQQGFYNARMPSRLFRNECALDDSGERTREMTFRRMGLSARAHDRILKVLAESRDGRELGRARRRHPGVSQYGATSRRFAVVAGYAVSR